MTGGPESDFTNWISFASALYVSLGHRIGRDIAFQVMEELLVSTGCSEQWDYPNSIDLAEGTEMERLLAFNELMDQFLGADQERTGDIPDLSQNQNADRTIRPPATGEVSLAYPDRDGDQCLGDLIHIL
jgi:hypothetical protein